MKPITDFFIATFVFAIAIWGTSSFASKKPNSNADFYNGGRSNSINSPGSYELSQSTMLYTNPVTNVAVYETTEVRYPRDARYNSDSRDVSNSESVTTEEELAPVAVAEDLNADNTRVNKRDRSKSELTADQQTTNVSDVEITRRIRQDLMKDQALSTYGQNVKIITVNGRVTLKGPVRSAAEEKSILDCARAVAGPSNVTNKLAIARN